MSNQYFEGILQLRNPNNEVLEFIKYLISKDGKVFISRQEKQKNGIDIYLSSRRFLQNIAVKLQKRFGGELKINPKLFSRDRQSSKDIYRINVLYRFPSFKKNDIISHKGDRLKILIVGKKLYVQDLKTMKKFWLDYEEFKS